MVNVIQKDPFIVIGSTRKVHPLDVARNPYVRVIKTQPVSSYRYFKNAPKIVGSLEVFTFETTSIRRMDMHGRIYEAPALLANPDIDVLELKPWCEIPEGWT